MTTCARCAQKLTEDTSVYSRHTRSHYCADITACARRAVRAMRRARKAK